jgi:hypothetical protein
VFLALYDALKETGATPGLQVHRSHGTADAHVERLNRNSGQPWLCG